MNQLADWMIRALKAAEDEDALAEIRGEVHALCEQFPCQEFDSLRPCSARKSAKVFNDK